jgi:hypothetical protein
MFFINILYYSAMPALFQYKENIMSRPGINLRDKYYVRRNGAKMTLHKACRDDGISYHSAYQRILTGLAPQAAFDLLVSLKSETEQSGMENNGH